MSFLTLLFLLIILLTSYSKSKKISTILKDYQCGTLAQKQHIIVNEVQPNKLDPVLTVMTYPCIGLMIPKTNKEIKIIFREFREG